MARPFIERPPNFKTRKPAQHRADLDIRAPLSRGLSCCVAFDICAQGGSIRDFANPAQSFTWNGVAQTQVSSLFGGGAVGSPNGSPFSGDFSGDFGPASSSLILSSPLPSTTKWSASYMAKFDGSGAGPFLDAPFCNSAGTVGIGASISTDQYVDLATSSFLWSPPITTFTTWTRHTWTSDGTTISLYSNGVLQSSVPLVMSLALGAIVAAWPRSMSDFFFWNRSLSAAEVANHNATPFSVLKPRYSERWWLTAGTCQPQRAFSSVFSTDFGPYTSSCGGTKPGLMTTGVGQ
jgi:hypothetical protein